MILGKKGLTKLENLYRVAVHYKNDNGFVEYQPDTKELKVILVNEAKRAEVEQFLTTEHTVNAPVNTIRDFEKYPFRPVESLSDLKLGLTRLWQKTGVHVDWSRPA